MKTLNSMIHNQFEPNSVDNADEASKIKYDKTASKKKFKDAD
jgi:hypothetical protein